MKRVGQLVGVEERFLVRAMRGKSFSRNLSWNQFHEICNWILTKQEPKRAHICNAQLILHLEKLASKLPGIWLNQNGGVESYQIHNWE